ncbi:MAG TPA: hypothetical protein EYQ31_17595 [Candidatus Handelsmanbacteria bacterium]|nr:hypothetical protein [Candidatus Handelsmanbacteria bacterium]
MSNSEALKQAVCDAVDRHRERVVGLGEAVGDHPEQAGVVQLQLEDAREDPAPQPPLLPWSR